MNLLAISEHCIFPLEEKEKRGGEGEKKKKGSSGKGEPEELGRPLERLTGPRCKDRRVIYLHEPSVVHYLFDAKSVRVENLILSPLGDSMIRREGRRSEESEG